MENKAFVNFFAVLITLIQFALWLLPAYMIYTSPSDPTGKPGCWGILYLPLFIMACVWGDMMRRKYF
jgi:hypothetical protein